jgi:hypothetical protein
MTDPPSPPANPRLPATLGERELQLQAALAEYSSLRQESMTAITNRITIANFTFGALAVILAGLLAQSRPGPVIGWVAILFVPQVSKTGLLIWLGEYDRSQRAGKWIADLEVWIDQEVLRGPASRRPAPQPRQAPSGRLLGRSARRLAGAVRGGWRWAAGGAGTRLPGTSASTKEIGINRPMGWESKLISQNQHMGYPYLATALLLLGAGWASVFVGLGIVYSAYHERGSVATAGVVIALLVAVAVETWFALFFRAKWIAVRLDYAIPVASGGLPRSI